MADEGEMESGGVRPRLVLLHRRSDSLEAVVTILFGVNVFRTADSKSGSSLIASEN
jgi:hypothetical protein